MGPYLFCFEDRVLSCGSKWPETRDIDQAGFELAEIDLPPAQSAGIKDVHDHI